MPPIKDFLLVAFQAVLFIAFFISSNPVFDYQAPTVLWLGLAFCTSGLLIGIVAVIQLNTNLSPFPSPLKGGTLVTKGLYRYVRHPIYLGIVLAMFGFSLASYSYPRLFLTIICYGFFILKARYEESLLLKRYREYGDYMKNTGMILPKI